MVDIVLTYLLVFYGLDYNTGFSTYFWHRT